jgi:branched-chain amino acid transport system substrate-binding protein
MKWVVLVLILLVGCTGHVVKDETIKIGILAPLTGPIPWYGTWMQNGLELALEDCGLDVELVYEDTACNPKQTITAINKFEMEGVVGYIGPFCGNSAKAASSLATELKKIMILPTSNFGKTSEFMFSTQILQSREGEIMAEFAYNNLSFRKIGLVYFNDDWGYTTVLGFAEKFEHFGGQIVGLEGFDYSTKDFRTVLLKLINNGAEAIYSVDNGDLIPNQLRELGYTIPLLGQYSIESPYTLKMSGKNAEGIIYTHRDLDESLNTVNNFGERYFERFGEVNEITSANTYDALKILVAGLRKCGLENNYCISEYIQNLKNYSGASGTITFDKETWNVEKPIVIKTVEGGEFVYY